jgi:hypothetical protein
MNQNLPKRDPRILKIIWGALILSQFIYGFALTRVTKDWEPQELNMPMTGAFSMLAILMCGLSFFIPKILINNAKKNLIKNQNDLQGMNLEVLVYHLAAAYVIRLALLESCALFGFIMAFMHKRIDLFFPFAALSITFFLINFPSEEKIRNAFR